MTSSASSKSSSSPGEDEEYELDDGNQHSLPALPAKPVKRDNETKKMIAGVAGNVLEWYDFAVFGYFSEEISEVFFPKQEGDAALVETFAIFGAAFFMRPIGGMILGYIGDTYGRKKALELSIFLMAFPTFLLGCLPPYSKVGNLSFVLLILVRLLQGLSVGGQLMSSLVFTVENQPKEKWGLYGSYVMAAANAGTLLGGVVAYLLKANLTPEQLISWGWRVPFLFGILASLAGIYLKFFCEGEGIAVGHLPDGPTPENPIIASFRNPIPLLAASLVPMLWSGGFYLSFVWMAVFMDDLNEEHPMSNPFAVNCFSLFFSVILMFPLAGILSDIYGRTKVMLVGASGLFFFSPLFLHIISLGETIPAFCAQTSMGIFLTLWGAPMCAWLAESFKPELRLTAVSIGYNVAQALIGGSTAAIATLLYSKFGALSPGFFLSGLSILGIIGLLIAPKVDVGGPPTSAGAVTNQGRNLSIAGETTSLTVDVPEIS